MISYEFGDILLVAFPQSGTTQTKRRPALVILDVGDADVVLAPITTRERSGRGDYFLRDWSAGGLLRASWVRLAKIASLEKRGVSRRLGHLSDHDKEELVTLWRQLYAL